MTALIGALLLAALFFHAVAALGVIRLPDFYTRLHAVSKAETLGVVLTVSAVALSAGVSVLAAKLVLVAVFLFLANPTSTHAIARAALRTGLKPWRRETEGSPPDGATIDRGSGEGREDAWMAEARRERAGEPA
jgi:multicomponent Na+:H+ antiporter subunit G